MKHICIIGLIVLCYTLGIFKLNAQTDSLQKLQLNYEEAKAMLLRENLSIIYAYYDITKSEAELIQAKLWRNPYFVWNQDLYSIEKNQYFNYQNQHLLQVEIVFPISGKHINTVRLGKLGVQQNRLIVQDIIRGLIYELGERYASLFAFQQKQLLYNDILDRYKSILENAENKLRIGAISLNEVIRLRSELINVKTDAIKNKNDIADEMSQMRTLLNLRETVEIITTDKNIPDTIPVLMDELITDALNSRPDYELDKLQIQYEEVGLKLEKANAIPDVKLAYQPIDRGSNYVRPYQGLVVEFSLPIFDRNQGNIKLAKAKIKQAEITQYQTENILRNEVANAFAKLLNARGGFDNFSDVFLTEIEELNNNAGINYDKKNINFLEFIDLQRIYIDNQLQFIEIKNEYQKAINYLNFTVGKEIIE